MTSPLGDFPKKFIMTKTYPQAVATPNASWIRMGAGKGPKCCICGAKATHSATVEINLYRGDDIGPYKACEVHAADADALLATSDAVAA